MAGETVLVVEDNAIIAFALKHALMRLGYKVIEPVDSGEEAIQVVTAQRPDLVLMDVALAGNIDGVTAAENIRAMASVPIIYLTGNPYDERLKQSPYLSKPVVEKELALLMEQTLRQTGG